MTGKEKTKRTWLCDLRDMTKDELIVTIKDLKYKLKEDKNSLKRDKYFFLTKIKIIENELKDLKLKLKSYDESYKIIKTKWQNTKI